MTMTLNPNNMKAEQRHRIRQLRNTITEPIEHITQRQEYLTSRIKRMQGDLTEVAEALAYYKKELEAFDERHGISNGMLEGVQL